jgi:outer membrane lipopolysaccharide assembly protein LptE/RlpB
MKMKSSCMKLLLILPILVLSGCSYSFTGSSVPNHLKSISIPFCIDRSGSGEPNMPDDFTSTLIEQFISDNSLSVTDKSKADALLDCTINSISDAPTVIEGGENVSARRLTINARVIYKDFVMKKTVFDKRFSNYGDYENSGDIPTNRSNAIQTAIDRITEDILLAVVSDW